MPTPGPTPKRPNGQTGKPYRPGQINNTEELTPRRAWLLARKAVECGWAATVHRNGVDRIQLVLTERHHCIHITFDRREYQGKPWNVKRSQVYTRCPADKLAKVRMSGLTEYLEVHPAQCAAVEGEQPDLWERLEQGRLNSCEYHLPPDWWEVDRRADNETED